MTSSDFQGLEPVVVVSTEFEAQTKAAVLDSEGIDCRVITQTPAWTGSITLGSSLQGTAVLVKPEDLERAKAILDHCVADSVDLDWDEVDVGEREDYLPVGPVGRVPRLAKIALTIFLLSLLAWLLGIGINLI